MMNWFKKLFSRSEQQEIIKAGLSLVCIQLPDSSEIITEAVVREDNGDFVLTNESKVILFNPYVPVIQHITAGNKRFSRHVFRKWKQSPAETKILLEHNAIAASYQPTELNSFKYWQQRIEDDLIDTHPELSKSLSSMTIDNPTKEDTVKLREEYKKFCHFITKAEDADKVALQNRSLSEKYHNGQIPEPLTVFQVQHSSSGSNLSKHRVNTNIGGRLIDYWFENGHP